MLLAIVPAYNEVTHIGSVVRNLFDHVDRVLVVDDCSKDGTADAARAAGATVLSHEMNRGQGAALQTGHEYARMHGVTHVLHFDGDGQFDVKDIAPAFEKCKAHDADILFGSRHLDNRSNVPWTKRYILHPLGRVFNYFFGGKLKLSDAHNGFRIIHTRALDRLVITQDRMAHASEIPALVAAHKLSYVEFPVRVEYREYGQGVRGVMPIIRDTIFGKWI